MKIQFIKPPENEQSGQLQTFSPPIGLWQMASILQAAGHDVRVADCHLDPAALACLDQEYDIIGFSVQFQSQQVWYEKFAAQLRPKTKLMIAGGPQAAFGPKPKEIDCIVRGSGTEYFVRMLGMTHHVAGCNYGDFQPYWEKGKPHGLKSSTKGKWSAIETSRGCNYACAFCAMPRFWGKWRPIPHNHLSLLLDNLKFRGVEELYIEDDNFSLDKMHFYFVMQMFGERKFKWSMPNGITAKEIQGMAQIMKDAGCWKVSFAFEALFEKNAILLGTQHKFCDYKQAKDIVDEFNDVGIETCGLFVIGHPEQTLGDIDAELVMANSLPLDDRAILILTPYPGTALMKYPRLQMLGNFRTCVLKSEHWTPKQVIALKEEDRKRAIRRKESEKTNSEKTNGKPAC